jgi:hypothetical protein
MASSYSTDLKLEIMVTGENAGQWGDITNTNLVILQQAITGFESVGLNATSGATLTFTNGALSNGKNAVLNLTGTLTSSVSVIIPDGIEKTYIVNNATTGSFAVLFKTTSGTGATWAAADKSTKIIYSNGTNIIDTGIVSETGIQNLTNKTITLGAALNTNSFNIIVNNSNGIVDENSNEQLKFVTTTTAVNELTITNAATSNSPVLSATGGDTNIGLTLTPKGTGKITLNGESKIFGVFENATISTTFVTAFTYDVLTQAVYFQNVNLGANFTVNLRGDGSNALNSVLATGESATVALITKQGNTTYYNTSVLVDGVSTGVTLVWQGTAAPTTGNTSSTDVYTYTALKTAASTYTVLASQTQFK